MVAQGNQGYAHELLHQSSQRHQPRELVVSLEELRPRLPGDSSASAMIYHQQSQAYYGLPEALQESPCATVYYDELEPPTTTVVAAGPPGGEIVTAPRRASDARVGTPSSSPTTPSTPSTTATPSPCLVVVVAKSAASTCRPAKVSPAEPVYSSTDQRMDTTTTPESIPTTTATMTVATEAVVATTVTSSAGTPAVVADQRQQHRQQSGTGRRHHSHHHHHHHHHHSSARSLSSLSERDDNQQHGVIGSVDDALEHPSKKRKILGHDGNDMEDEGDDAKSIRSNNDCKKQNHSEIEKRRRDKMNTYITELSAMIPMCHAMSRKLDKLTVLRMAVQHLKTILGAVTSYTEGHYKPAFLSDQELKTLILQAAEGFVFVVGCDRGRILYVSKSVSQALNYSQDDLLGQSWFDILHPKDVAKVKEQLSSSDLSPRERLIDAKTMLPVKTDVPQGVSRLCPGARRSFFCRMKRKVDARCPETQVKEEADTTTGSHRRKKQQNHDWKYCVIQCTGYLKSWAPAKMSLEDQEPEADTEACNLSCLVAVGRVQAPLIGPSSAPRRLRLRTIEFVSRHAIDGKFLFVDQRATLVLGFLPQELLGTSMYEYYHHDDIPHLAESHKTALQTTEPVTTQVYRFRGKGASFVKLRSEWRSFKNPWTKDIEYLIAKNSAVFSDTRQVESSANRSEGGSVQENYDYFAQSNGGLERLISSHVEVSKIGRQIAEEALDLQRRSDHDSSSGSSPMSGLEAALLNHETQITTTASPEQTSDIRQASSDNSSSDPTSLYSQMNNVQLNIIASDQHSEDDMIDMISGTTINESSNPGPTDGNDEAAMAVIMSLLEADAGLGGPVDFSGLPWPLP
ncbi:aryl hydrocarbon receptor nuclear translocator-like protein 1 isoform X2 [Copidosoma floridanum]|nr:aryl hydrocarbon receptor nuclear translocator-like protein 1 isoform X2 [Copidosoma floridanum]